MEQLRQWNIRLSILLCAALSLCTAQAERPALLDCVWNEDFEDGTVSGWSSYPPYQDTAYDFSLLCGYYREPNSLLGYVASGEFLYPLGLAPPEQPEGNRYYALRAYRPNSLSAQRLGFAHRFSQFVFDDSSLSFDYWLKLTSSESDLLVELAGADGRRYQYRKSSMMRDRWEKVTVPFSAFTADGESPKPGLEIQAISIMAVLVHGDPAVMHHFAIDNVEMRCRHRAGFEISNPKTYAYKHWELAFCSKHYYPGDALELEVSPQSPVESVHARLEDFSGHVIAADLPLGKHGNGWMLNGDFRFTESHKAGPMLLVIEGETPGGEILQTRMRLWFFHRPADLGHPRLFFTDADIDSLKKRTTEERYKPIWDRLVRQAENAREVDIPLDGQIQDMHADYLISDVPPYFAVLRTNARYIMQNAIVYAIGGDEEAGNYAKDGLLKMAAWEQWVHPWFRTQGRKSYYPVGIAAMELGIAYDLLQPILENAERSQIRSGIMRNGIVNSWEEYFVDNRMPTHTSNWISHCTAGPLVALLAFYQGYLPDELSEFGLMANGEPYFSGLAEKFLTHSLATFKSDGGYGEGYGYQNFTMSTAGPALAALNEIFGVETLSEELNINRAYLYPLYISHNDTKSLLDMGDSSDSRSSSTNWAWFTKHHKDPVLKWFYDQSPGSDFSDFLWLDDSLQSESAESLPPNRVFREKGNVVLRTGWTDDDIIFNFRAGPNYNHTHIDQGTFRLWGYGEELAAEAGPGGYYTDPYYWSLTIQSAGHNTVLIDDNPESQEIGDFANETVAFNNHARLERALITPSASMLRAELGMLYRGLLDRFSRTVYFTQSHCLVFWDRILSSGDKHHYQWQMFPPDLRKLQIDKTKAVYTGENAQLMAHVLSPSHPTLKLKNLPASQYALNKFPKSPFPPRGVLQVTHEEPVGDQDFLVVLVPSRIGGEEQPQLKTVAKLGFWSVQIDDGNKSEYLYFTAGKEIKAELEADVSSAYLGRTEDGQVNSVLVDGCTTLKIDSDDWASSNYPVALSYERKTSSAEWTIQAELESEVHLRVQSGDVDVSGNAELVRCDGKWCVLIVREGNAVLTFDL